MTRPSNADQDDIINFIDDPETTKKAVEGSMDKRLKALAEADPQADIREAIAKILDRDIPDNDEQEAALIDDLIALFQAHQQEAYKKGYIDGSLKERKIGELNG